MKIRYAFQFAAACLLLIFLTAGTETIDSSKSFFGALGVEPVLPDEPFDYDINFPEHVVFGNWSTVDSTVINAMITPEGATLGRVLFYDKLLSKSNDLSCGSCHKQEFAFADNKQFSDGINGAITERNSPNLNDLVWGSSFFFGQSGVEKPLFWDGRVNNLEFMVLLPIEHEGELGKDIDVLVEKLKATEYYAPLFEAAYGTSNITGDRIGDALAQFVRSMSSFNSKFDQVMKGQEFFTTQEQEGFELFEANCGTFCHGDPHFGSATLMNNGLDSLYLDEGMADWSGNSGDVGKFRSPSLRNIELTGPYMHDGRFETLEEVIDFYSDEVFPHPNNDFGWTIGNSNTFRGFEFNEWEKEALKAFMLTLTDESFITDERWSDPFEEASSSSFVPLDEKVNIYPNPFRDQATVELDNASGASYTLRLTTVDGRVLRTFKTTSSTLVIEKQNLQAGVYMLEVKKGNRMQVEKIVVQ
ncbi:MAG: cytochrome c peroxidase [Bacteroidota bacterium]